MSLEWHKYYFYHFTVNIDFHSKSNHIKSLYFSDKRFHKRGGERQTDKQTHRQNKPISLLYSACNCVISSSHNTKELIQLQLQESYCLLILTYAAPAFNSDVCVTKDLNVCWNSVYRRLFHYNRWESVKCCIKGLGTWSIS